MSHKAVFGIRDKLAVAKKKDCLTVFRKGEVGSIRHGACCGRACPAFEKVAIRDLDFGGERPEHWLAPKWPLGTISVQGVPGNVCRTFL